MKVMMHFSPESIFNYTDISLYTYCRDRNSSVVSLISKVVWKKNYSHPSWARMILNWKCYCSIHIIMVWWKKKLLIRHNIPLLLTLAYTKKNINLAYSFCPGDLGKCIHRRTAEAIKCIRSSRKWLITGHGRNETLRSHTTSVRA